ncbi:hypothetical protein D9M71_549260 [compost metagenome]
MVGQRAVVHQAQVGAGGKRVAAFHGHGAFGGHTGVTDDVAALHAAQAEALGDFFWQSHALENFDALTGAHDAHGRRQFAQCGAYGGFFSFDLKHNRAGVLKPVKRCAELAFKRRNQSIEVVPIGGGLQGQLDPAIRYFIAVDGKAGTVRATVGHGFEHGFEELAKLGFQLRFFKVQTYDSTHGDAPY